MKALNQFLFVCLISFQAIGLVAQNYIIETDITLFPPYPSNLDYYIEALENGVFSATNTSTQTQDVYFRATITETTAGLISLTTDENTIDPVPLEPGITIFDSDNINQIFGDLGIDDVNTDGLTQEDLDAIYLNRQLPEGQYEICLLAFDINGVAISDPSAPCFNFDLLYAERPIITSPYDGEEWPEGAPLAMTWDFIVYNQEISDRLEFVVKIIDLTAEDIDDPQLAMLEPAVPTVFNENIGPLYYHTAFPETDIMLIPDNEYAMRVTVIDPLQQISFGNDAHSEIVLFTYDKYEEYIQPIVEAPYFTSEEGEHEFSSEDPLALSWAHNSTGIVDQVNYLAFVVDLTNSDLEEDDLEDSLKEQDNFDWVGDDFQNTIFIPMDEMEWEDGNTYAAMIRVTSENGLDTFANNGFSEVYVFDAVSIEEDAEYDEPPLPVVSLPLPNSILNLDEVTLKWAHNLDPLEHGDYATNTTYKLQIIDLTEQKVPNASVEDFTNINVKKLKNEVLTSTPKTKIIKPAAPIPPNTVPKVLFKPGHYYAIAVQAIAGTPVGGGDPLEAYENFGYSNIVTFRRKAEDTPLVTVPLPVINTPLNNTTLLEDVVHITWEHALNQNDHPLWWLQTKYKIQVIDLKKRGITNPKPVDFASGEEKMWDKDVDLDTESSKLFVQPAAEGKPFIEGQKYALAIRAICSDPNLEYSNLGYSNIVVWTHSDEPPLPYIIEPENNTISMENPKIVKWDHGLDPDNHKALLNGTNHFIRILDLTAINNENNTIKKNYATIEMFEDEVKYPRWLSAPLDFQTKEVTIPDPGNNGGNTFKKGHRYAIVIQAKKGLTEAYPNKGYSDIIHFTYDTATADGCPSSDCLTDLPANKTSVAITDAMVEAMNKPNQNNQNNQNSQQTKFLSMGGLNMKITSLDPGGSAGDGYSGEGEIIVGFIGAGMKVKVEFTDIKINSSKEIFAGSAKAVYDTSFGEIDALISAGSTMALDVDHEAAKTLTSSLRSAGRLASALSGKIATSLPIGFDKIVGNDTTIIGITKMTFSPRRNNLMAIMSFKNPDWGQYVPAFGADKICFNNEGFGSQVKMYLHEDFTIETDIGDLILEAADPNDNSVMGTYIELNCNGFKEAQITGSLALDREHLLPVDKETGDIIEDEDIKAKITVSGIIQRQNNFLLGAQVSPCEIPGLDGFSVSFKNGWFDGSDKSNPVGLEFPNGYTPNETGKLWRGFWFEEFSITAPKDWAGGSDDARTKVAMYDFIMDDTGISVVGSAENLLSIKKGAYEGFAISLDKINVHIVRNQFRKATLDGKLGLPILPNDEELSDEEKYLSYSGFIEKIDPTMLPQPPTPQTNFQTAYALTVSAPELEYQIPSIRSTLRFYQTTQIMVKRDIKEKGVMALLEGSLTLGYKDEASEEDNVGLNIPSLVMEGMMFSTIKQYRITNPPQSQKFFTPPTISFVGLPGFGQDNTGNQGAGGGAGGGVGGGPGGGPGGGAPPEPEEPAVNGFPIGLDEVSINFGENGDASAEDVTEGTPVSLTVAGHVSIVQSGETAKKGSFDLSAEASITVGAEVKKPDGKFTFAFKSIDGGSLAVDANLGGMAIKGSLEFYNKDPEFGVGIVGDVAIEVPAASVDVQARFGNTQYTDPAQDNFAYFYLFGKVDLTGGIPIPNTGITLHRFLGGAYRGLEVKEGQENGTDPREKYTPAIETGFAFKAGLGFSFTRPELFFATMALTFEINQHGGFKSLMLDGQVDMFQQDPFANKEAAELDGLRLKGNLTVKAPTPVGDPLEVTGNLDVFANLVNGLLVGDQKNAQPNQVVSGSLNVVGNTFAASLGTYQEPGAVKVVIPDLGNAIDLDIRGTFYVQAAMGQPMTFVEAPVPSFIDSLLNLGKAGDFKPASGNPEIVYPKTYDNEFAAAAGMQLKMDLDITVAIFYAHFRAMIGFDASIFPNNGVYCSNHGNSKKGFGPDQHYIKGQVYAGFEGGCGLDIDIGIFKGRIELAYIYAAVLLQGGFPNPFYASGQASLGFRVLGGLISGHIYIDVNIGEPCEEFIFDPLAGAKFMEGLHPNKGATKVSPFVKPKVSFQNRIGKYTYYKPNLTTDTLPGDKAEFDVRLIEFVIIDPDGKIVDISEYPDKGEGLQFTVAKDQLSAYIRLISLQKNTKYTLRAKLQAFLYDPKLKSWIPARTADGNIVYEEEEVTFETGEMPDYVTWDNVQDCYPFRDEEYYMIDNNVNDQGIINLRANQEYLFEPFTPEGQQWHSKAVAEIYEIPSIQYWYGARDGEAVKIWSSDVSYSNSTLKRPKATLGYRGVVKYSYEDNGFVIHYNIPKEILKNSSKYKIEINRVWYENPNYDLGISELDNLVAGDTDTSSTTTTYLIYDRKGRSYTNTTERRPENKNLCSYGFKTSRYNNIQQKLFSGSASELDFKYGYYYYRFKFYSQEGFSEQEVGNRNIAESQTINNNCLFIQESFRTLPGSLYYSDRSFGKGTYYLAPAAFEKYKLVSTEKFDVHDNEVRDLYVEDFTIGSMRTIISKVNTIYPSKDDLKALLSNIKKRIDFYSAYGNDYNDLVETLEFVYSSRFGTNPDNQIRHGQGYYVNYGSSFGARHDINILYTVPTFDGKYIMYPSVEDIEKDYPKPNLARDSN